MFKKLFIIYMLFTVTPAFSLSFDDGVKAYHNKDYTKAIEIFKKLADKGDLKSINSLGVMYEQGTGVLLNYSTAAEWYKKGADLGFSESQNNLGRLYMNGFGVPQDNKKAIRYFLKAVDQDLPAAYSNLGIMAIRLGGERVSYEDARTLLIYSVERGVINSLTSLGVLYTDGLGVEKDFVMGYMWFNLGAAVGLTQSVQGRNMVEPFLSPAQLELAQRLSEECLKNKYKNCGRKLNK